MYQQSRSNLSSSLTIRQNMYPRQEQNLVLRRQPSNIVLVPKEIMKIEYALVKCAERQHPDGTKDTYCTLEKTTYHLKEKTRGF